MLAFGFLQIKPGSKSCSLCMAPCTLLGAGEWGCYHHTLLDLVYPSSLLLVCQCIQKVGWPKHAKFDTKQLLIRALKCTNAWAFPESTSDCNHCSHSKAAFTNAQDLNSKVQQSTAKCPYCLRITRFAEVLQPIVLTLTILSTTSTV